MDLRETIGDENGKVRGAVEDLLEDGFRIGPEKSFREGSADGCFDGLFHLHRLDGGDELEARDAVVMGCARRVERHDASATFEDGDDEVARRSADHPIRNASEACSRGVAEDVKLNLRRVDCRVR